MNQEQNDRKRGRDIRADHVGFSNEIGKSFADPIKTAVKARMEADALDIVEGDFFEGLLVTGTRGMIDPAKVFRLIKKGELTESQFLECISVNREKLSEYLGGKEVDRLSDFTPASPQLRITRRKGVEVTLANAIRTIGSNLPAAA
jgi:hypothetical protein